MKSILVIFFILLFQLTSYADNSINVYNKETFSLSPEASIKGKWELEKYDRSKVLLLNVKKEKNVKNFVFKALSPGKTKIKLINKENINTQSAEYLVTIQSFKQNKIFKKKPNPKKFNLSLKQKENKRKNNKRTKIIKTKISQNEKVQYSYPEKEIMKSPDSYFSFIQNLNNRKLYTKALTEIDKFRTLYPNSKYSDKLDLLKGSIYTNTNRHGMAIGWYRQLIDENEENQNLTPKEMLLLAAAYKDNNELNNSKITYIKIITLFHDPKALAKSHLELGKIYFIEKDYPKGIKELEHLIEMYPDAKIERENSLYLLGTLYYQDSELRNYKTAYSYFRMLVEEYPDGSYSEKAVDTMKYLKNNFINYY